MALFIIGKSDTVGEQDRKSSGQSETFRRINAFLTIAHLLQPLDTGQSILAVIDDPGVVAQVLDRANHVPSTGWGTTIRSFYVRILDVGGGISEFDSGAASGDADGAGQDIGEG